MTVLTAKVERLTFHDFRGTAVTPLFVADCSEAQVATIMGHTLAEVKSILDSTDLSRDYTMAEETIAKLETRTENAKRASKWPGGFETAKEKPAKNGGLSCQSRANLSPHANSLFAGKMQGRKRTREVVWTMPLPDPPMPAAGRS